MRELGLGAYRLLGRLAADPADRQRPGQAARASTSTTGSSTGCSAQGITPWVDALPLGPARRRSRTPAAGRRATPPTGSPSTPAIVADALGDRVKHWITLNEPWCSAFLGYGSGMHAPGRADDADAVAAAHHLLLGHGLAVEALRAAAPDAQVGITLNLYPVTPADDAPGVGDAARRIDGLQNRWFLDPVLRGAYPADVRRGPRRALTDLAASATATSAMIAAPLDFLGVNYYTRHVVRPGRPTRAVAGVEFVGRGLPTHGRWAGRSTPTA